MNIIVSEGQKENTFLKKRIYHSYGANHDPWKICLSPTALPSWKWSFIRH